MRKMFLFAALACLGGLAVADVASAHGRSYCGWGHSYHGAYRHYGRVYNSCGFVRVYTSGYFCQPTYYYPNSCVTAASAPARLIVHLPADAVLTIDGRPTTSTSSERVFNTPDLDMNRTFEYCLEAKVVRDGQEKVIKQRVAVRGGEQTTVDLDMSAAAE
jgi:uncharacterized protein (TIGR03000 family)